MHCRLFQVVLTNKHQFWRWMSYLLAGDGFFVNAKGFRARRGVLLWRWWRTIQSLSCSYPSWCKCKSFFLHFSVEQIIPCVRERYQQFLRDGPPVIPRATLWRTTGTRVVHTVDLNCSEKNIGRRIWHFSFLETRQLKSQGTSESSKLLRLSY